MASLVFQSVSFFYSGSPVHLFEDIAFGVSEGWTGVLGANGAGKTTLLQLACGLLSPEAGNIHRPDRIAYCPQRTDLPPPELSTLLASPNGEAYRLRGMLEIEEDYEDRWETLSHGERKRAQIAACLWTRPRLLAIDEPTNHLDLQARSLVLKALRSYDGIGLLVSHDRDLLDTLCSHCLFVRPPAVVLRSGGYTDALAGLEAENRFAMEQKRKAARDRKRLERELDVRRRHEQKAHKARSKRGIDRKDHDAKSKVDQARLADSGAGKSLRQLEGRIQHAESREASYVIHKNRNTGIPISGQRSQRNVLFSIDQTSLSLGERRTLHVPALLMQPGDRIALMGANGCGKSTLIRHILTQIDLPNDQMVSIPQEIDIKASAEVLQTVKRLNSSRLGEVMQWVSQLGSNPERLLDSLVPSPGEARKLLLALRMTDHPALIVMDEPTNHMDLPSIECIESALSTYDGGLLLVSHDLRFLSATTTITWTIAPDEHDRDRMNLTIQQGRSVDVMEPKLSP